MQVKKVPAAYGWRWVVEGFSTFFKLPSAMLATGALLMFTLLITSAIPVPLLGPAIPLLLTPALSFGFAVVTREVLAGRRPSPFLLFSGLGPKAVGVRRELLILGLINAGATLVAILLAQLIDGGGWTSMLLGEQPADAAGEATTEAVEAALLFMMVYAPFQAAFWFAPLYVGMHRIPAVRAIFFSAVSVWRNKASLLVYFFGWLAVGLGWSIAIRIIVAALSLSQATATLVMMIALLVLMVVVYSSYWPTYRDVVEPTTEVADLT